MESMEENPPLRLENPMSSEQAVMRTSLRASILQTVSNNLRRERGIVAVFESGREYLTRPGERPEERELIVGAVGGFRTGRWGEATAEAVDFYDAKGMVEEIFERCGVDVSFGAAEEYGLLRGRTAGLSAGNGKAGILGQVHPEVASQFEIEGPVFLFEIDVAKVAESGEGESRYRSPSRFPAVIQDIALVVDESVPAAKVTQLIASSAQVADVKLFDVYEGAPLLEGKRSLAFAVQFQSAEKTLTDAEVAEARNRIVRRLQHEVGAELRG
jgi:phenylalanyl-tRNA synthetase beta chain